MGVAATKTLSFSLDEKETKNQAKLKAAHPLSRFPQPDVIKTSESASVMSNRNLEGLLTLLLWLSKMTLSGNHEWALEEFKRKLEERRINSRDRGRWKDRSSQVTVR